MAIDYYREGRNYEILMKRVFNKWYNSKKDTKREFFIALFEIDKKVLSYGNLTQYNRHFLRIKLNIERALLKLTKKKKYYHSYDHFAPTLAKLREATTPKQLVKIINITLLKIIKLENSLKEKQFGQPPQSA